jgi:hypothetical protein
MSAVPNIRGFDILQHIGYRPYLIELAAIRILLRALLTRVDPGSDESSNALPKPMKVPAISPSNRRYSRQ